MTEWTEGVFRHMSSRLQKDTQRHRRDQWHRWADSKAKAISRRIKNRRSVKKESESRFGDYWCHAIVDMARRIKREQIYLDSDEWKLWANRRTSGTNLRNRSYRGGGRTDSGYDSTRFEPTKGVSSAREGKIKRTQGSDRKAGV